MGGEGGKGIKIKNYTQINLDDVFFICFSIYLIIFLFCYFNKFRRFYANKCETCY